MCNQWSLSLSGPFSAAVIYHLYIAVKKSLCFCRVIILAFLRFLQHERSSISYNILFVLCCPSCSWSISNQYYSEVPMVCRLRLRLWLPSSWKCPDCPSLEMSAVTSYLVCFFETQTVSLLYQILNGTVERVLSQNTELFHSVNGWSWPICRRSNSAQQSPILALHPFAPGRCNTIALRAYCLNKWPATEWRSLTSINLNFYIWGSCWGPYRLKLNCCGAVCLIQGQILLQFEQQLVPRGNPLFGGLSESWQTLLPLLKRQSSWCRCFYLQLEMLPSVAL